jgi:tRNA-specific 2-thiouridylase
VLEIRPKTNTVVVGPKEALDITEIAGTSYTWCGEPQENPDIEFDVEVQIRAHADPVPAVAQLVGGELVVRPTTPLNSVAAGQTAVLYVDTRVLGQFTIARTVSDLNVVATA